MVDLRQTLIRLHAVGGRGKVDRPARERGRETVDDKVRHELLDRRVARNERAHSGPERTIVDVDDARKAARQEPWIQAHGVRVGAVPRRQRAHAEHMVLGRLVELRQVLHQRLRISRFARAVKAASCARLDVKLGGANDRSVRIVRNLAQVLAKEVVCLRIPSDADLRLDKREFLLDVEQVGILQVVAELGQLGHRLHEGAHGARVGLDRRAVKQLGVDYNKPSVLDEAVAARNVIVELVGGSEAKELGEVVKLASLARRIDGRAIRRCAKVHARVGHLSIRNGHVAQSRLGLRVCRAAVVVAVAQAEVVGQRLEDVDDSRQGDVGRRKVAKAANKVVVGLAYDGVHLTSIVGGAARRKRLTVDQKGTVDGRHPASTRRSDDTLSLEGEPHLDDGLLQTHVGKQLAKVLGDIDAVLVDRRARDNVNVAHVGHQETLLLERARHRSNRLIHLHTWELAHIVGFDRRVSGARATCCALKHVELDAIVK